MEAENEIVKVISSPNDEFIAIAFIRDAGATTDFSPQVSVLKKGQDLGNKAGNVFRGTGSESVDLEWTEDGSLIIYHNVSKNKIIKQKKTIFNIKIIYRVIKKL